MQGRYASTTFGPLNSYLNSQLMPTFGTTRIDRFKPSQIADWFFTYSRNAPGGANAALGHLRSILSYARDHGILDPTHPDPTAPIRLNHRLSCGQLLNSQQLHALGKVLTQPPSGTAPAARAIRLHDLRHTYASQAIMSGETLATTGALLGHNDPESTEQYAHLDGGHLVEAVEVACAEVEALLFSAAERISDLK